MDKNQMHFPEFGYSDPIETKEKCSNPAFMNCYKHRIGCFDLGEFSDGEKGHRIQKRCVNCGRNFKIYFMTNRTLKKLGYKK